MSLSVPEQRQLAEIEGQLAKEAYLVKLAARLGASRGNRLRLTLLPVLWPLAMVLVLGEVSVMAVGIGISRTSMALAGGITSALTVASMAAALVFLRRRHTGRMPPF